MSEPAPLLDREGIEEAFRRLGDRLAKRGVVADIYVFGGAAEGLRRLSAYVRALPGDDPRLHAIDAAWQSGDADPTTPDMILSEYGFGPGSHLGLPDQDEFFTLYAEEWSRQRALESVYRQNPDRVRRLISDDESARDVVAVAHRRESVGMFRRLLDDDDFLTSR